MTCSSCIYAFRPSSPIRGGEKKKRFFFPLFRIYVFLVKNMMGAFYYTPSSAEPSLHRFSVRIIRRAGTAARIVPRTTNPRKVIPSKTVPRIVPRTIILKIVPRNVLRTFRRPGSQEGFRHRPARPTGAESARTRRR